MTSGYNMTAEIKNMAVEKKGETKMKKTSIIINETNKQRIEKMIEEAQGQASARLITFSDIVNATAEIESKLGITKKSLEDTSADIDIHAQDFPNSYKYRAESTHFLIEYRGGKWRLNSVIRHYTRGRLHTYQIKLSDTAKAAVLENAARLS